jgi:hypothetical protein
MFYTKAEFVDYMVQGHIHLSKKDYGFFSNLKFIISDKKFITTNQANLCDKLIHKYKRQLLKQGYQSDELINLKWGVQVNETSIEYLHPKVYVENELLCFTLPFNNLFLQYFKRFNNNPFEWNKNKRRYECVASTFALKLAILCLKKFFSDIKYDETLTSVFLSLKDYEAKYWQPTLVKSAGVYYIACLNNSLYAQIKDLVLNDDPLTLYTLSRHGIVIDESVIENDNFKKFASNYYNTIDLEDLPKALMYLRLLDIAQVTLASEMIYSKEISKEVKQKIHDAGIECYPPYIKSTDDTVLLQYTKNAHSIKKTQKILKCITLTNSRPVDIR